MAKDAQPNSGTLFVNPLPKIPKVGKPATQTKPGTGSDLFTELGIIPGKDLKLDVPSDPVSGRSYITYVLKDVKGEVTYVGRASGIGTPKEVLNDRLKKGHDHYKSDLKAVIVDVQPEKLASQGAEEVFHQGYLDLGKKLTNVDPPLSYDRAYRIVRSLQKLQAFFDYHYSK